MENVGCTPPARIIIHVRQIFLAKSVGVLIPWDYYSALKSYLEILIKRCGSLVLMVYLFHPDSTTETQ
jgi:hypothetical protein